MSHFLRDNTNVFISNTETVTDILIESNFKLTPQRAQMDRTLAKIISFCCHFNLLGSTVGLLISVLLKCFFFV